MKEQLYPVGNTELEVKSTKGAVIMIQDNTSGTKTLTLSDLKHIVDGNAQVVRRVTHFEPEGGPGGKFCPPTYSKDGKSSLYASETRMINGKKTDCCSVDSVQSQANRVEDGLYASMKRGEITIPSFEVDVEKAGVGSPILSSIKDLPHRTADAILRDSVTSDGTPFYLSEDYSKMMDDTDDNATDTFGMHPTNLLLGVYNVMRLPGMNKVAQQRLPRAMASEIVALDCCLGTKTTSRIDPLQINLAASPVYVGKDKLWTLDPEQAQLDDKSDPVQFEGKDGKPGKGGKKGKNSKGAGKQDADQDSDSATAGASEDDTGRPSHVGHGSQLPQLDITTGGITASDIVRHTTISVARINQYYFPIDGKNSEEVNVAARTVLLALGLCGATLANGNSFLRSRCTLVATSGSTSWEVMADDGSSRKFVLDKKTAVLLLNEAVRDAKALGLPWRDDPVRLVASDELIKAVKKSFAKGDKE